jgi:drug/metabolite transporter (DMT)-like permease
VGERERNTFLGLALAVIAVSTSAPAIRIAEPLDHSLIAAGRVCVTAFGLALVAPRSTMTALRACAEPKVGVRVLAAGILLAAHFALWIASLGATSVIRSVALVSTQPLFAGLFARLIGDRAPWTLFAGTALAVAGSVVLVSGGEVAGSTGGGAFFGDVLAIGGAATAAAYLSLGRSVKEQLPLAGYFALVNVVAALGLLALVAVRRPFGDLASVGPTDVFAVAWVGLVPGLVGHGLLNWAVRRTPVHVVSLAVLVEPIGASLLAWILIGEAVGPMEAIGAAIVIGGVGVGLLPVHSGPEGRAVHSGPEGRAVNSRASGPDPRPPTNSPTA